jgi:hypothetical protein
MFVSYQNCGGNSTAFKTANVAALSGAKPSGGGSNPAPVPGDEDLESSGCENKNLNDIDSVIVNINQVHIYAAGPSGVSLDSSVPSGPFNMISLNSAVAIPIPATVLNGFNPPPPVPLQINQVRFILDVEGNFIQWKDGTICPLHTPSGQQSGVKFMANSNQTLSLSPGATFSFKSSFSPSNDVVKLGSGRYNLHPQFPLLNP